MKKKLAYGKRFTGNLLYLIITVLAMAGGAAVFAAKLGKEWIVEKWGKVPVEEIVYQFKVPLKTTLDAELEELFYYAVPAALLLAVIICVVMTALRKRRLFAGIMAFVILVTAYVNIPQYYEQAKKAVPYEEYQAMRKENPDVIEQNYVDPRSVEITFPKKKRNLIYIFVESVENTFMSKMDGGAYDVNYIPELTELAEENLNFSHTDQVGGAYEVEGIRWTVASMFAQTSGLPLLIPIARNAMNGQEYFFPKVWSLGNILEQEGYQQELLIGSDAIFGGRLQYFTQHGNYKIYDYGTARDNGKFPPDYRVWWGYEDQKLFEYAKEEITELAAGEEAV